MSYGLLHHLFSGLELCHCLLLLETGLSVYYGQIPPFSYVKSDTIQIINESDIHKPDIQ